MSESIAIPLPVVGETIAGKYRIVRALGAGGMALVYEAVHLGLERRVALKMLAPELVKNEVMSVRFRREARAIAQIQSQHVARVLDIDVMPSGPPFMVLELLDGNDLQSELESRADMTVREAVDYVRQAALGMADAHPLGIVHRDLKPANLFLCRPVTPGARRLVKVLDFGISKIEHEQDRRVTHYEEAFGTPQYMSPEQIRAARDVDGRSDVWALGVVLYECLTGHPPFEGDAPSVIAAIAADPVPPPSTRNPSLPRELEAVILKALHKDVTQRYQTARELADALAPWAPSEALIAPPTPPTAFMPVSFSDVEPPSAQAMVIPSRGAPPSSRNPASNRTDAKLAVTQLDTTMDAKAPRRGWLLAVAAAMLIASALALGVHKTPELAVPASLGPSNVSSPAEPPPAPAPEPALPAVAVPADSIVATPVPARSMPSNKRPPPPRAPAKSRPNSSSF